MLLSLIVFSTGKMESDGFPIESFSLCDHLFNACKYGSGIAHFNYGISRGWIKVHFGPKNKFRWSVLVVTNSISSFSPTDLFPRYIRETFLNQHALLI
jgi:hypothetical protein